MKRVAVYPVVVIFLCGFSHIRDDIPTCQKWPTGLAGISCMSLTMSHTMNILANPARLRQSSERASSGAPAFTSAAANSRPKASARYSGALCNKVLVRVQVMFITPPVSLRYRHPLTVVSCCTRADVVLHCFGHDCSPASQARVLCTKLVCNSHHSIGIYFTNNEMLVILIKARPVPWRWSGTLSVHGDRYLPEAVRFIQLTVDSAC